MKDDFCSPRFPQPFLDVLGTLLTWRDVLSLTSVDRREAPMRIYWLNDKSVVVEDAIQQQDELLSFVARFPRCRRRPKTPAITVIVFFSGVGISTYYDVHLVANAALRQSLRPLGGVSGGGLVLSDLRGGRLTIRDDFDHVISSFLEQLPHALQVGQGMMFMYRHSPEGIRIVIKDGIVSFDDFNGEYVTAPVDAVLTALLNAKARFDTILLLVATEAIDQSL